MVIGERVRGRKVRRGAEGLEGKKWLVREEEKGADRGRDESSEIEGKGREIWAERGEGKGREEGGRRRE